MRHDDPALPPVKERLATSTLLGAAHLWAERAQRAERRVRWYRWVFWSAMALYVSSQVVWVVLCWNF
jgi:hypothetical protein